MSEENTKANPQYPYPKKRPPKPNPMHRHKHNLHGWDRIPEHLQSIFKHEARK